MLYEIHRGVWNGPVGTPYKILCRSGAIAREPLQARPEIVMAMAMVMVMVMDWDQLAAGKYVEGRSKFYAHLYRLDENTDPKSTREAVLKHHRHQYKRACHHCYALRQKTRTTGNGRHGGRRAVEEQFGDDGEVGRPGRVLLDLLVKHELEDHLLVVSRIFGGKKLGVGGVSRAFCAAGEGVIQMVIAER